MLQGPNLTMVGLGVANDTPVNALQPKLAGGIHLRAMFDRDLGFPWYGFYLFRRPSGPAAPVCLAAWTASLPVGAMAVTTRDTPLAQIRSDANLVVCDDFPAKGRAELNLDGRRALRVELKEPAWRVTATIGFRENPSQLQDATENFIGGLPAGYPLPNPLQRSLQFTSYDAGGKLSAGMKTAGPPSALIPAQGLLFGAKLVIVFPPSARNVVIEVTGAAAATAFDPDGHAIPAGVQSGASPYPKFDGPVARVEITGTPEAVIVRRVLWQSPTPGATTEVRLTSYSGTAVVGQQRLAGAAGQVLSATFSFDGITAVEIAGAPAALIDLCATSILTGATAGWAAVPGLTLPIGLPVVHANYPLSPATAAAATTLALSRVRYGPQSRWQGTPLQELQSQLAEMVKGGPAGTAMAAQKSPMQDSLGTPDAPSMPALYPLDLVLLGSLHPAIAQMIGLYVVDDQAPENQPFDYLLVADYTGVGQKDSAKILALVQANDFTRIEAFIAFNLRRASAPPLAPPSGLTAFALPGMTMPDADGTLIDATNNVGLNWDIGRSSSGDILPGKPILHHLWRAALGNGATPQAASTFSWLTGPATPSDPSDPDNPVFVTAPSLPGGAKPERPPGWPPPETPLHFIDRALADGWYAYKSAGIDIFGRFTPDSAPVTIRVRDLTPPPAPAAVEAWVLDPDDPSFVRDTPYKAWRTAQTAVGLRVRWSWTIAHQRQAPDTKEFRIYLHPGSEPPADLRNAAQWQTRYFTVGYNEFVVDGYTPATDRNGTAYAGTVTGVSGNRLTLQSAAPLSELPPLGARIAVGSAAAIPILSVTSNSVTVPSTAGIAIGALWEIRYPLRVYDVFIPRAGQPPVDVPLTPTIQDPLLYAHVGVTAVDDKTTADNPKWAATAWGNRPGNEGAVSAPAKIYRVLRQPPQPPAPIGGDARVYATRANIDGQSFATYRWTRQPFLRTHVFRALYDSVVQCDWRIRTTRRALDPSNAAHADLFPTEWSAAAKQAAAQSVNAITAKAAYASLNADAQRLLAALPGNAMPRMTAVDADWRIRSTRAQLTANDADFFPQTAYWDATRRQAVAAALNGIQKLEDYAALSDDALRILAGLPGNHLAFSQITIQPLGDECADARGPDDPAGYTPSSAVLAFRDTLPGLTAARYFYRSALVTTAHNISELGLASRPVYVPNVRPPRMPAIIAVRGGDRSIALSWRPSSEPNLQERRVYRTTSETAAADVRDMQRVATLPASAVQWADTGIIPRQIYFYRITAVDADGLESPATPPAAARAFDDARPDPPVWSPVQTAPANAIILKWTSTVPDLRCLVQRKAPTDTAWTSLTAWLKPGVYQSRDAARAAGAHYTYRLLVRDKAERQNRKFNELTY